MVFFKRHNTDHPPVAVSVALPSADGGTHVVVARAPSLSPSRRFAPRRAARPAAPFPAPPVGPRARRSPGRARGAAGKRQISPVCGAGFFPAGSPPLPRPPPLPQPAALRENSFRVVSFRPAGKVEDGALAGLSDCEHHA